MSKHMIDMNTYPRRDHFEHFRSMVNPFLEVTVNVDITGLREKAKAANAPFFLTLMYLIGRAANSVPEFRQRIAEGGIAQYDYCKSSRSVMRPDGTYRYAQADTSLPFDEYIKDAKETERRALEEEELVEHEDTESLLYFSCLPWISFTHISVPWPDGGFSVPMITVGKFFEQGGRMLIPVAITVNHALMDGMHAGAFYSRLDEEIQAFIK